MSRELFQWRWISHPHGLVDKEAALRKRQNCSASALWSEQLVRGGNVYVLRKQRAFWFEKQFECYVAFDHTKRGVLLMIGSYHDHSGMLPRILDGHSEDVVLPQRHVAQTCLADLVKNCADCEHPEQLARLQKEEHQRAVREYREQRATKLRQLNQQREQVIHRLNRDGLDSHTLINAGAEHVPENHQRLFLKQVYECIDMYLIDPERQLGELGGFT